MHQPVGHGATTSTGIPHRKLLMWSFIGSDCLFFGALIASYVVYHGQSLTGPTPTEILNIPFTSVSTFVLLTSSLMMVLGLAAVQRDDQRSARLWLLATAGLGLVFLAGQVYEFSTFAHEGLTPSTNLFGTTFFTLTGFHGAHVTIGVIWLLAIVALSWRQGLGPDRALDVETAGLYWHFVDVVWIVIFTVVYLFSVL